MAGGTIGRTVEIDAKWADHGVAAGLKDVDQGMDRIEGGGQRATRSLRGVREEMGLGQRVLQDWQRNLTNMVLGYVSLQAALKLGDLVIQMDIASHRTAALSQVIDRQLIGSGRNASGVIAALRVQTMGLVTDAALLEQTYVGLDAFSKMGMSADRAIELIETMSRFAVVQAQLRGVDPGQVMQTIMTGLTRGSVAFLDNYGIYLDQQALFNDRMSETEKKAVVVEAAFQQVRDMLGETADEVERNISVWSRLARFWETMKNPAADAQTAGPSSTPFGMTAAQTRDFIAQLERQHGMPQMGRIPGFDDLARMSNNTGAPGYFDNKVTPGSQTPTDTAAEKRMREWRAYRAEHVEEWLAADRATTDAARWAAEDEVVAKQVYEARLRMADAETMAVIERETRLKIEEQLTALVKRDLERMQRQAEAYLRQPIEDPKWARSMDRWDEQGDERSTWGQFFGIGKTRTYSWSDARGKHKKDYGPGFFGELSDAFVGGMPLSGMKGELGGMIGQQLFSGLVYGPMGMLTGALTQPLTDLATTATSKLIDAAKELFGAGNELSEAAKAQIRYTTASAQSSIQRFLGNDREALRWYLKGEVDLYRSQGGGQGATGVELARLVNAGMLEQAIAWFRENWDMIQLHGEKNIPQLVGALMTVEDAIGQNTAAILELSRQFADDMWIASLRSGASDLFGGARSDEERLRIRERLEGEVADYWQYSGYGSYAGSYPDPAPPPPPPPPPPASQFDPLDTNKDGVVSSAEQYAGHTDAPVARITITIVTPEGENIGEAIAEADAAGTLRATVDLGDYKNVPVRFQTTI